MAKVADGVASPSLLLLPRVDGVRAVALTRWLKSAPRTTDMEREADGPQVASLPLLPHVDGARAVALTRWLKSAPRTTDMVKAADGLQVANPPLLPHVDGAKVAVLTSERYQVSHCERQRSYMQKFTFPGCLQNQMAWRFVCNLLNVYQTNSSFYR